MGDFNNKENFKVKYSKNDIIELVKNLINKGI